LLCFVVIAVVGVVFNTLYREVRYGTEREKSLPQRTQGITG
jgi:hypothetical protein